MQPSDGFGELHAPSTPSRENNVFRAVADRAAIERWEGEGGRTLELEASVSVQTDAIDLCRGFEAREGKERSQSAGG